MNVIETTIKDLYILEPKVFEDERGYFFEAYNKKRLYDSNIELDFVQDNQSKSNYGVIRGLHFQHSPKAQTKLVRVLKGIIYDVALDIRRNSPTFGKWFGLELSEQNRKQLLIPKGFAHGFSVLSKNAIVFYKCDEYYSPEHDAGILYKDPKLNIDWKVPESKAVLSNKDLKQPLFDSLKLH